MKRMILLIMSGATLCQAMDVDDPTVGTVAKKARTKKTAKSCEHKAYFDDSDPTLRMEKIWHHGSPVRDEKPLGTLAKRTVSKKAIELDDEKRAEDVLPSHSYIMDLEKQERLSPVEKRQQAAVKVDKEKRSAGMSVSVFLDALDSAFPSNSSYASLLMNLRRERVEKERKKAIEEEERRAPIFNRIKERQQAAALVFRGKTMLSLTALVIMQQAAAPLLVEREVSPILALQESISFESAERKLMAVPIKRAPAFHHNKFFPKNEKRSSKKGSHHIQQPCKR